MSAESELQRIPTGLYWDRELWGQARAAYVSDLDHDPEPAESFVAWLHRALRAHLDRGPAGRASCGVRQPNRGRGQGRGMSRMTPIEPDLLALVDDALVQDRRHGRLLSRSGFTHEAVTLAVTGAIGRRGGPLPEVTGRLPNHPVAKGRKSRA